MVAVTCSQPSRPRTRAESLYSLPQPVIATAPTPAASSVVVDEFARRLLNLFEVVPTLELDDDDRPDPQLLTLAPDAVAAFEVWERKLAVESTR